MNNQKDKSINNNEGGFFHKIKSIKHIKLIVFLLIIAIVLLSVESIISKNKPVEKPVNMNPTEERLAHTIASYSFLF